MIGDWWTFDGTLLYGLAHDGRLLELRRISGGWRIIIHEQADDGWIEMHVDLTDGQGCLQLFRDLLGVRHRRRRWHPACEEGEQ